MGNNQSVSSNSTGFINPNFISGNVPDHSVFDDDRSTGIRIIIITIECSIYVYIKISIDINLFIRRAVITGPRLAALGFALLLRHLFVDRINLLSLGVNVFVSERAPGLMMQLLQQLHSLLLQTRH
jgi:hypothetical protein